jgi:hypothetical protein
MTALLMQIDTATSSFVLHVVCYEHFTWVHNFIDFEVGLHCAQYIREVSHAAPLAHGLRALSVPDSNMR